MRVLLIDSSELVLDEIHSIMIGLHPDLRVEEFVYVKNIREALLKINEIQINGIFCDSEYHVQSIMEDLDSIQFLKNLKANPHTKDIPIFLYGNQMSDKLLKEIFLLDCRDFFMKPFREVDFIKASKVIYKHYQMDHLRKKLLEMGTSIDGANEGLKKREQEIIIRLAKASETRDQETGNHIHRVGEYSFLLAESLNLPYHEQEMISRASLLHDVGKIAVPDAILQKTDKLTSQERNIMQLHTLYGFRVLYSEEIDILKMGAQMALYHHERYDGKGYPYGKKGPEIPLYGRIVMVADVFDALSSARRYKQAWTLDQCFNTLNQDANTAFDPQLVKLFCDRRSEVEKIYYRLKDQS